MDKTIEFLINKKDNGERLDVFLSKEIKEFTRSYIKKLIEKKKVVLNKIINTSPSKKIKTNDKIIVNVIEQESHKIVPNKIKLEIWLLSLDRNKLKKLKSCKNYPKKDQEKLLDPLQKWELN